MDKANYVFKKFAEAGFHAKMKGLQKALKEKPDGTYNEIWHSQEVMAAKVKEHPIAFALIGDAVPEQYLLNKGITYKGMFSSPEFTPSAYKKYVEED